MIRFTVLFQSIYYIATGIWPLVSMATFEAVTGEKTDDWLVQTVGVLAAIIGASLLIGCLRGDLSRETIVLSILGAAGFAGVDIVFYMQDRISAIYLADAVAQSVILSVHLLVFFGWRQRVARSG